MRKFLIANKHQRGGALIVILFVTLIAVFFAAQLTTLNKHANESNTYEVLSARAYWASRSLVERLVYEMVSSHSTRIASCSKPYQIKAFPGCNIVPVCISQNADDEAVVVTATATCSESAYRVSRKFEVEVRP